MQRKKIQKTKKLQITLTALTLIVIISCFSGCITLDVLGGGDYHTGFNLSDFNNCKTKGYEGGCTTVGIDTGCWYGNILKDYVEIIRSPSNNAPVVTSMKRGEGERSIEITCSANLGYLGMAYRYWEPDYGWYNVQIKYTPSGSWQTIIDTKDGYVDESIVAFVNGATSKQRYYDWDGNPMVGVYVLKTLQPITFALKGSIVGVLRVRQITEFSALYGLDKLQPRVMSEDHAFLISGKGTVDIVDSQTRYVEGVDTIRFRVTTGFSGYTQGGEYISRGWVLKVFDNYGNLKKSWNIADDKQNSRYDKNGNLLDYAIPSGSFNPTGSNTWVAVLTNTLFDQDDETFFAISQEALAKAPDIKPIVFSESEYNMGDTVSITFEGIPNAAGRNKIDGFLVNIKYGTSGMDYVLDYHRKYITASGNSATVSFIAAKGDTYITVEAWAFDAPESSGGVMSEKAQGQVWVKDKDHAPSSSNLIAIVIAILVFFIFLVAAFIAPLPGGWIGKIVLVVLGVVVAVVTYILII